MLADCISFKDTGYFSNLILDYLEQKQEVKHLYNRYPELENFKKQIEEKQSEYNEEHRKILVDSLRAQYHGIEVSEATDANLNSLAQTKTFTITTGHQLNLFTGPLYFLYKIISTVNLTKKLKASYPDCNFVPVYWMATEDHDFEEINFFNFKGKKFQWNKEVSGAVGALSTEGLQEVFDLLNLELGVGSDADELRRLFQEAYLKHDTLDAATRFLANEIFGAYGLVIVDGNDRGLKRLFSPYVADELLHQHSYNAVVDVVEDLSSRGYGVQVNPREINLFYLKEGLRERIVKTDDGFVVNDTELKFSKTEILKELHDYPERFSPNVLLRPLYQEVILPNLCYIGGGGELAYWLQLKSFFNKVGVVFPTLLLRNSALLVSGKEDDKLKRLEISYPLLFLKRHSFINRRVREISDIDINFDPQRAHLKNQFEGMYALAEKTDETFLNAVKAQEVKQLKGLDKLEKRLLKAQKRKLSDEVSRMTAIQETLFPNGNLQERTKNFSEFYAENGKALIRELFEDLDPLKEAFLIVKL
ncbi:bacillithiol biosynthesis cysteine-adding enzyme BshC [Zhouia amylolytica]|uniref:Putative cysteine ligase BshC n=1 Tax=Zhouia amylolytica TaxID=376730 RepID=A0A1I6UZJ2_9FLAO|nr:bacillithiol biosynthesis cysteine-adding enzyme BshC [Zhouia amylolytica]SFT06814.1 bacillithiol biosynthesis cysteine-adding enzyme BshC [Zhouia amylolytica]